MGMRAGSSELLAELKFELWIGDAAEIRSQASTQAEDGSPGCAATFCDCC